MIEQTLPKGPIVMTNKEHHFIQPPTPQALRSLLKKNYPGAK
jgi:hypothetical protein